jgi:flagellar basal-body rod protein FlgB
MKVIEGEAPMFEKLELTRMAQALAAHAGTRLTGIARNVANADTPGYRAVDTPDFAQVYRDGNAFALKATRPGHLGFGQQRAESPLLPAGGPMSPNGNDVTLDIQMMKAVEARQSHEMALAIYANTTAILRASLGRSS